MDAAEAYPMLRERISALVADADGSIPTPACPSWRVHDVLAHVVGVTSDVLAGRLDGVATDPWTAAQVESRRDATLGEMIDEWTANAEAFDAVIPAMGPVSGQLIFDTWTHEQDLRGALQQPGHRDGPEILLAFEFLLTWWKPQVAVVSDGWTFSPDDGAPATLRASRFELMRTFSGRRSADQVAALDWHPEPRPELVRFDFFGFRENPLVE